MFRKPTKWLYLAREIYTLVNHHTAANGSFDKQNLQWPIYKKALNIKSCVMTNYMGFTAIHSPNTDRRIGLWWSASCSLQLPLSAIIKNRL
jgi:hypothetical protein